MTHIVCAVTLSDLWKCWNCT